MQRDVAAFSWSCYAMDRLQAFLTLVLVLLCASAIGVCLWSIFIHGQTDSALIAAVVLLGLAQIIGYFAKAQRSDGLARIKRDIVRTQRAVGYELDSLSNRLDALERDRKAQTGQVAQQLADQVRSLELTVSALTRTQNPSGENGSPPATAAGQQPPSKATAELDEMAGDPDKKILQFVPEELELYLEPVVRVAEDKTVYYRASLAFARQDGTRIGVQALHGEARRGGYLSDLELLTFTRVAPVLRKLHARERKLGVFCPITAHSFADWAFVQQLLGYLEENKDIAGFLVVEVTQRALSQLDKNGTEGLAYLAQLGATFCLSETRVEVPDVDTLANLGFGFIDMNVEFLRRLSKAGPDGNGSMIMAAAKRDISFIAANVAAKDDLDGLDDIVLLARGPYFSPPRLVRQEAGEPLRAIG